MLKYFFLKVHRNINKTSKYGIWKKPIKGVNLFQIELRKTIQKRETKH